MFERRPEGERWVYPAEGFYHLSPHRARVLHYMGGFLWRSDRWAVRIERLFVHWQEAEYRSGFRTEEEAREFANGRLDEIARPIGGSIISPV